LRLIPRAGAHGENPTAQRESTISAMKVVQILHFVQDDNAEYWFKSEMMQIQQDGAKISDYETASVS